MKSRPNLQQLFGIELPIVQAPMAGAQASTLAIAVSNAGGLGSLPCAMLSFDALRKELEATLAPQRLPVDELASHPWGEAPGLDDGAGQRRPGAQSRWTGTRELGWEPLRIGLVAEVSYEHMQGDRFRHTARFLNWRPDRDADSCTYAQLDVPPPVELAWFREARAE